MPARTGVKIQAGPECVTPPAPHSSSHPLFLHLQDDGEGPGLALWGLLRSSKETMDSRGLCKGPRAVVILWNRPSGPAKKPGAGIGARERALWLRVCCSSQALSAFSSHTYFRYSHTTACNSSSRPSLTPSSGLTQTYTHTLTCTQ